MKSSFKNNINKDREYDIESTKGSENLDFCVKFSSQSLFVHEELPGMKDKGRNSNNVLVRV